MANEELLERLIATCMYIPQAVPLQFKIGAPGSTRIARSTPYGYGAVI
jgi:hypothetical protein